MDIEDIEKGMQKLLKGLPAKLAGKSLGLQGRQSSDSMSVETRLFFGAVQVGDHKAVQNFLLKDVSPDATDNHGRSGLHVAALNDHQDIFSALLNRGADPEKADESGITPLMCASQKGCDRIIDMLLDNGVDVAKRNSANQNAVFYALFKGHVGIAEKLEQKRSCVHDLQEEPLIAIYMKAVSKNWLDVVKFLSERKCDVSRSNKLLIASQAALCGHTEILKYFSQVDFKEKTEDGRSPLLGAVQNGFDDAVEYMLSKGCDLSNCEDAVRMAIVASHLKILRMLLDNGAPMCKTDENGITPVQLAIVQGSFEMFKYLVEKNCSLESHHKLGSLALIAASRRKFDVLKYLAENGYAVDESDKESGETPLLAACQNGPFEAVELLLNHGCNPNARNHRGVTPALRAANNNQEEILMLLAEKGAKLDLPNTRTGDNAMLCAARNKSLSMVRFLADQGCQLDVKDLDGKTVAAYAVEKNNVPLLKFLQQKKVCLDVPDERGMTPLMLAVKSKSVEAIQQLTSTPDLCNVNHRNLKGATATHLAIASGNIKLVELLKEKGADFSATDHDGNTPLLESLKHKKAYDMLLYLIKNGCDLQATDDFLRSAVHYACTLQKNDALMLLLDFNCPFDTIDNIGMTPFLISAEQGSESLVTILKAVGADVNRRNMKGKNAAHLAAKKGDLKLIQCCSLFGCNLDQEDNDGKTPLIFACSKNKPEIVEFLLRKEADANALTHRARTPVHYACKAGSIELLKLLQEKGAELDLRDLNGVTPMMLAAERQGPEILNFLRDKKCDLTRTDAKMRTALHFAVNGKNEEAVGFLIDNGLNPNALDESGNSPISLSIKTNQTAVLALLRSKGGIVSDLFDSKSMNTAHFACKLGNLELLKALVKEDVSISSRTADGDTCLTIACSNGHEEVVKFLVGKNINVKYKTPQGDNALHIAAKKSQLVLLPLLIQSGIPVSEKNRDGETVLHILCQKSCSSKVDNMQELRTHTEEQIHKLKQLVDQGPEAMKPELMKIVEKTRALPDALINKGMQLINCVGKSSLTQQLDTVLKAGADVNEATCSGKTPLHFACQDGSKHVIKILLSNEAQLNPQDSDGETPIFVAIRNGKSKVVQLLVDRGADLNVTNKNGISPYSLAICLNEDAIKKILESKGAQFDPAATVSHLTVTSIFKRGSLGHLDRLLELGFDGKKVENGKTLLHHAILTGNVSIIEGLRDPRYTFVKEILDEQDSYGDTALHLALMRGRLDMAAVLIQLGCRKDLRNAKEHTVLHVAAIENKLALVKWVTEQCPEACQPHRTEAEIRTPQHFAAIKGNLEVFKILEQIGFSAATTCKNGLNSAHYAAIHGNLHVLQYLKVSNPDAALELFKQKNKSGFLPIQCAVLNGHEKIANFLYKSVPSLPKCIVHQAAALGNQHLVDWVQKRGVDMKAVDPETGETALRAAISSGNFHLVKRFATSDLIVTNKHGNTPAQLAAAKDHKHILLFLRNRDAELDIQDEDGDTAISDCAINGCLESMKMLVRFGCNLKHKNKKLRSIVHLACIGWHKKGHRDVLEFAVENNVPLDEGDEESNTGLMYACRQGFKDIVDFLLNSKQCDLDKANKQGSTAAHLAAMAGRADIIDALSKHGAQFSAEDASGVTPLMIAVHRDSLDCVNLLAEKAGLGDGTGKERLEQLATWASPQVRQVLEQHGARIVLSEETQDAAQRPAEVGIDIDMSLCDHSNERVRQQDVVQANADQRSGSALTSAPDLPAEATALLELRRPEFEQAAPEADDESNAGDLSNDPSGSEVQTPAEQQEPIPNCQQQ